MTQLEKFRAFTSRQADKKLTSAYYLEDLDRNTLVVFTENRVTAIKDNGPEGEDETTNINYKDATVEYFVEAPKEHPLVTTPHTVLVQTEKQKIVAECFPYDFNRIQTIVAGKLKEPSDTV